MNVPFLAANQIYFTTIAPSPTPSNRIVTHTATPSPKSTMTPIPTRPSHATTEGSILPSTPTQSLPAAQATNAPALTWPLDDTVPFTQTPLVTMTTSRIQDPVQSQTTLSIISIILFIILIFVEWSTIRVWLNQGGSWRDMNNTV